MRESETKPLFLIAWQQKWILLTCLVVLTALGVAYTAICNPVWEATATIVFPTRSPSLLGGGGVTDQGPLSVALTGGPTPLKIYKGFLESERALTEVASTLGLKRKEVFKARKIVDQSMENSLTISARSLNPDLAKQLVQAHLDALTKINREVSEPLYADDASVLGRKLEEQQIRVRELESQLQHFQESAITAPTVSAVGTGKETTVLAGASRWSDLQRQLEVDVRRINGRIQAIQKQVAQATGNSSLLPSNLPPVRKWRDRLVELEYELKIKEISFAPASPEILQLREAVSETKANLQKEISAYTGAIKTGALDPSAGTESIAGLVTERFGIEAQLEAVRRLAKLAPAESISLSRLTRELTTQSGILQQIQAQYELAKIQEMRNPNRWQILDEPTVNEDPVNKSFAKNGLISMFLGLVLGMILALIRDTKLESRFAPTVETIERRKAA